MKRISLVRICAIAAAILAVAAVPAAAMIIELGQTKTPLVAPTCPPGVAPKFCTIVLTEVTALETIRDGTAYPTKVKQPGYIVAWTVGLSIISNNQKAERGVIHYFDGLYGTARAGIVVLKPVGRHRLFKWQGVAASPIVHVQPYFGQVVQFVLLKPLRVVPGETIALTIPTWAPVLSIGLATKPFAYRQSRTTDCNNATTPPPSAQAVGQTVVYGCNYPGNRVEY
ncbi:MAG TPA: hypothetical protein VIX82_17880, partial [Solirubrobacteraceae bacterium]